MKNKIGFPYTRRGLRLFLPVLVITAIASMPARANMIIMVGSAVGTKGSAGDFLDVTLTNTGPSAQNIAGFNFEISTTDTDITFTQVNTSTVGTYIFAVDSLFGPTISNGTPNPGPGQIIDAADISSGPGNNMAAGQTLSLGHVLFNVSSTAALGGFTVTLNTTTPGATSLSDSAGNNVTFSGVNGSITINSAAGVPESSTLLLMLLALPALTIARRRFR
jgi:hypothetical protein